jgi:hypothetical protein
MAKKKAKGKKPVNKQDQAKNILVQQIQTNKRLKEEVQPLQAKTDELETDLYRYNDNFESKVSLIKQEAKKLGKGKVGVKYNQLLDRVLFVEQKINAMLDKDGGVNPVKVSDAVEAEINTPEWNYLGELDPNHMFHRKTYSGGHTIFLHEDDDSDEEIPVEVQATEEMLYRYKEEGKIMPFPNYRSNKLYKELEILGGVLSRTGSAGSGIIRNNYSTTKETLLGRLEGAGGVIAKARQKIEGMEEQIEENNKGISQFFDALISPPDAVDRYEIYDKLTDEQKGLALSAETTQKIQAIQDIVIGKATDLQEQQQAEGVKQELAEQAAQEEKRQAEQAAAAEQAEAEQAAAQAQAEQAAAQSAQAGQYKERQDKLEDMETKISSMDIQRVKGGGRPITEGTAEKRPARSGGKASARREAYRRRMNFNIYEGSLVNKRIRRSSGGGGGDDDDSDEEDRSRDDSDEPKDKTNFTSKEIREAKTKAYLDYYNELDDLSATQQEREIATGLRKKNRLKNLYEKLAYGLDMKTLQSQGVYNAIKSIVLGDTDLKNLQEKVEGEVQDKALDTSKKTVKGKQFVGSFIAKREQARTYLREPNEPLDYQRGGKSVSFGKDSDIERTVFKGGKIPQTTQERTSRFFQHTIKTANRVKTTREKVKGELKGNLEKLTAERAYREGRAEYLPTVQAERTQTRIAELNRTENVAGGEDIINISGGGAEGGEPADPRPFVERYAERRAEADIQRIEPKYSKPMGEQTVPSAYLVSEKIVLGEPTFPTFSQKIKADFGTTEYNLERKGRLNAKFGEKKEKYIQEWADDATVLKAFKLDPIEETEKGGMTDQQEHELSTQRLAESMMALGDTTTAREKFEGEEGFQEEKRGIVNLNPDLRRANIEAAARDLYSQQQQLLMNFEKFQNTKATILPYFKGDKPYPMNSNPSSAISLFFGNQYIADFNTDFEEEKAKALKPAMEGGKTTSIMSNEEIPTPINLISHTESKKTYAVGDLGVNAEPMSKFSGDNGVGDLVAINKFYIGNRVVYWGHTKPKDTPQPTDFNSFGGNGLSYTIPTRPLVNITTAKGKPIQFGFTSFLNVLENPLYTDNTLDPVRTEDIPSNIRFQSFVDESNYPSKTIQGDFQIVRGYTDKGGVEKPYNESMFPANPQSTAITTKSIKLNQVGEQSYDNYFVERGTVPQKFESVRKGTKTTIAPTKETPSDQKARLRRIQRNAMLFSSHNVSTTIQGKF